MAGLIPAGWCANCGALQADGLAQSGDFVKVGRIAIVMLVAEAAAWLRHDFHVSHLQLLAAA